MPVTPLSTPDRSAYLLAARGEPVPHTPVWFMRQAGRALPEYRALRQGITMLESCMRPDLVVEITLQPVRRYGVDAAIFYSDIVLPLKAAGFDVEIKPGVGPVVADPIRDAEGVSRVRPVTPSDVSFTTESVQQLVGELGGTPLIGFAGAPFTVASYLVEGGPSKDFAKTKAMMHRDPDLWHALADRLADVAIAYLAVQVEAGASAIQLFDSWAGGLSPRDYERFVLPHSAKVFEALKEYGVPRVHFGVNTGELLGLMSAAGADVVGVDWRVPLDEAVRRAGPKPVQGNLDPALLFAGWEAIEPEIDRILVEGKAAPGHIFNLGHGVPPDADPEVLRRIVEYVQTKSAHVPA
ncbi:uroporphyrinogen decarboxylase [Kribbella sp. NPDC055110]